nr:hypothetical protein [Tanacetum cinerariifolium]
YINTKPNCELIHYCLANEPYKYRLIANPETPATPSIDGAPPTWPSRVMETYATILEGIKKKIDVEAEVVHIILTRIDNDIYSTVDACSNAMETKFTSRDGETLDSYYSRFYKMMNELVRNKCQNQDLKTISYHKLYDILKQHQNEVNEIRAKRLARIANLLTLVVATQQLDYHPQTKPTHYTQTSSTRSQAATSNKGKEIVNTSLPTYDLEPEKICKPTNNNLKTSSNTINKNVNDTSKYDRRTWVVQQAGIYNFNCKEFRHVARECKKTKKVRDSAYHKENMLLCKKEESRIQLSVEQVDWLDDTDDKPEDQELEAQYMYTIKIQEVILDAVDNSGSIFDTKPLEKVHKANDNYNVFANERQHLEQPEFIKDTHVMENDDRNISLDSSNVCNDEG